MNTCTCPCTCGGNRMERFVRTATVMPSNFRMMGKDVDGITLYTEYRPILSHGKWWNGGRNKYGDRLANDGVPRLYERVSEHTWKEVTI